jgi:ABC-2 type transport system ATP-binding protein
MDQKIKLAVVIKDLYKSFKLPHEQHSGFKQMLVNKMKGKKGYEIQHVLKNVSFEVREGEFFGIVGRNGSGKSTLLKLLASIYAPDKGLIQVNGTLVPFIELGVGFNPELTGRENVFLNGALLGMSRAEITKVYDEIVEFAELEKFMDQKLKNYSSGMQVRLAFSIAIRSKGEILLIDEVLAVGDAKFQDKCLKVFRRLKKEGRTIIFISHDMGMVKKFCDRAIMIKDGEIIAEGDAAKVAECYDEANLPETQTLEYINKKIGKSRNKIITNFALVDQSQKPVKTVAASEKIQLHMTYGNTSVENIGVALYTVDDVYIFGTNTFIDNTLSHSGKTVYEIEAPPSSGRYYFKIGIFGSTENDILEFYDQGPAFQVTSNNKWEGILFLSHTWKEN